MRILATIWTVLASIVLFALGMGIFMTNSTSWLLAIVMLVQSVGLISLSAMLVKDSRWE